VVLDAFLVLAVGFDFASVDCRFDPFFFAFLHRSGADCVDCRLVRFAKLPRMEDQKTRERGGQGKRTAWVIRLGVVADSAQSLVV
jgi:hypothetical protein